MTSSGRKERRKKQLERGVERVVIHSSEPALILLFFHTLPIHYQCKEVTSGIK
jgi:hypothetical protein